MTRWLLGGCAVLQLSSLRLQRYWRRRRRHTAHPRDGSLFVPLLHMPLLSGLARPSQASPSSAPWLRLISFAALVGYYFAAFTIDRPWMGRMRMQAMGFAWMGKTRVFFVWLSKLHTCCCPCQVQGVCGSVVAQLCT